MPNLRFSDNLVQNGLIGNAGLGSTNDGFKDNTTEFYMMQNTIPTQTEFDNAGSSFRLSDRLWRDTNADVITTLGSNTISISFRELNASATGIATWFYWDAVPSSLTTASTARIIGSISITGGSGDLTMADVNIVSGQPYSIGPIVLTIPASYTYT